MTGTALEQGCELDEKADTPVVSGSRKQTKTQSSTRQSWCNDRRRTAQTLLRVQRLSSRSPSTRSSASLSRCRGRNPVCQKTLSARFHSRRIQKIVEIHQFSAHCQDRGDFIRREIMKTAQMPLVQFTENLFEVTMIMQTSSGSPSMTANSGDASDSGSGSSSEWWIHSNSCRRQRHWQAAETTRVKVHEGCRGDTGDRCQENEPAILED